MYSDFDIIEQRPRHFSPISRKPTVLRTERPEIIDPEVSLVSDSKGLYDALSNELPQDDKKSAVEMPIIEALLNRMTGRSRWVPHNFNPADGLTKLKGAHLAPLLDLLKTGFYHLKTEETQLKDRATEKAELGRTSRLKQGSSSSSSMFARNQYRCFFSRVVSSRRCVTPPLDQRPVDRNHTSCIDISSNTNTNTELSYISWRARIQTIILIP